MAVSALTMSFEASVPNYGFECYFLHLDGEEVGTINGPQTEEREAFLSRLVGAFNATGWRPWSTVQDAPKGEPFLAYEKQFRVSKAGYRPGRFEIVQFMPDDEIGWRLCHSFNIKPDFWMRIPCPDEEAA